MRKLMVLSFSPSLDRDVLSIFKRVMSSRTIEEVSKSQKGVGWTAFWCRRQASKQKRTTKQKRKKKKKKHFFSIRNAYRPTLFDKETIEETGRVVKECLVKSSSAPRVWKNDVRNLAIFHSVGKTA